MTKTHEHAAETAGHTIHWARLYGFVGWITGLPRIHKSAVKLARLQAGEAVLDVGCGPGELTLRAARKVGIEGRVAGIDASPEMIAEARKNATKKGRDVDFRVAAIEGLPFGDGEFDVVLSSFMLHHLPDDVKDAGLAEVRRVLKPGGRFVAVDISPGSGLRGRFLKFVGHRMPDDYGKQLRERIAATGFEETELFEKPEHSAVYLRAMR